MTIYAIGDIQGCFNALENLLQKINFQPSKDQLWFTGDLVNRGEKSLEVLRFVHSLGNNAITVLGNHDLHLLAIIHHQQTLNSSDTLQTILRASDRDILCNWLQKQPLLHHDHITGYTLVHAGLAPQWDLVSAKQYAFEVQQVLQSDKATDFFAHMYGDTPNIWQENLSGWERLRFITNTLTRIRFCNANGALDFSSKADLKQVNSNIMPWFRHPQRKSKSLKIIFGHWAALYNQWAEVIQEPNLYPLDSGCVWGNCLTALRLSDGARISVPC